MSPQVKSSNRSYQPSSQSPLHASTKSSIDTNPPAPIITSTHHQKQSPATSASTATTHYQHQLLPQRASTSTIHHRPPPAFKASTANTATTATISSRNHGLRPHGHLPKGPWTSATESGWNLRCVRSGHSTTATYSTGAAILPGSAFPGNDGADGEQVHAVKTASRKGWSELVCIPARISSRPLRVRNIPLS